MRVGENGEEYDEEAVKDTFEKLLPGFKRVARECGYALAVHGTMSRDLDLIAVPWVEVPRSAPELAFAIAKVCRGKLIGIETPKHHRRLFQIDLPWRELENRNYIELSVTPLAPLESSGNDNGTDPSD